jgi:hypothetical protein
VRTFLSRPIEGEWPYEHPDWLYYEYFPEAQTIDLQDFWSPDTIVSMRATGFVAISVEPEHIRFDQDLRVWLDMVQRRDLNSQLMAISDRVYQGGIARLTRELAEGSAPRVRAPLPNLNNSPPESV